MAMLGCLYSEVCAHRQCPKISNSQGIVSFSLSAFRPLKSRIITHIRGLVTPLITTLNPKPSIPTEPFKGTPIRGLITPLLTTHVSDEGLRLRIWGFRV